MESSNISSALVQKKEKKISEDLKLNNYSKIK